MSSASMPRNSSAEKVLVTGATGTVGRHVTRGLSERGVPVVAATRDPARARNALGVPGVRFDFEDRSTYDAAFDGVDALFLVRPPALTRVGRSIFPALDAAWRSGIRRVVFLSVLGAGQNPFVPHRWIEEKLRAMDRSVGLPWTVLRPSFFLQNLATTHRAEIRDRDEIFVPAGTGRTSFVDARDVAAAGVTTLVEEGHAGCAYALTGTDALTYGEVATILTAVLGRPIRYADPSLLDFVRRQRREGRSWAFVLVMTGIYLTARFGLAARVTDDLPHLLGRAPRTVRDFAEDYAEGWE
jgi:uncharacterized protein YbjT (DUF2867 family)